VLFYFLTKRTLRSEKAKRNELRIYYLQSKKLFWIFYERCQKFKTASNAGGARKDENMGLKQEIKEYTLT
jgi:hypothetical protein